MYDTTAVCALVKSGAIKEISYSFKNSAGLYGKPQFWPIIRGDGWTYFPTENTSMGRNEVPDEVIDAFNRVSLYYPFVDVFLKRFFDQMLDTLESGGYTIREWFDPVEPLKFNAHKELFIE